MVLLAVSTGCGGIAIIDADGEGGGAATEEPADEPVPCGGPDDPACAATEFCDRPEGNCVGAGVCLPRPETCAPGGPEVCACDGVVYASSCEALRHGVEDGGAQAWCPLVPQARARFEYARLSVNYVDPVAGICVRLFGEQDADARVLPIEMWSTWKATTVVADPVTDGCLHDYSPKGATLVAAGATGSVRLEELDAFPQSCALNVDIVAEFPAAPWIASPFTLHYPHALVQGSCP
jgi:hypothetical protein